MWCEVNSYWETRYASGGTSGDGSVGVLREWKWRVIKQFAYPIDEVIDVGCGDMSFWKNEQVPTGYIGIDGSFTIIQKNKEKYPNATFYCNTAESLMSITAPVVFCFDMLFHIMDDGEYRAIIDNLCRYATKTLFVYTWVDNPIRKFHFFVSDRDEYERFHDPVAMCSRIKSLGFSTPIVFRSDYDKYGAMFVFRKVN